MWKSNKLQEPCIGCVGSFTLNAASQRVFSRDAINFQNLKLKSHQSFYPHKAWRVLNLYLFTAFHLNEKNNGCARAL